MTTENHRWLPSLLRKPMWKVLLRTGPLGGAILALACFLIPGVVSSIAWSLRYPTSTSTNGIFLFWGSVVALVIGGVVGLASAVAAVAAGAVVRAATESTRAIVIAICAATFTVGGVVAFYMIPLLTFWNPWITGVSTGAGCAVGFGLISALWLRFNVEARRQMTSSRRG